MMTTEEWNDKPTGTKALTDEELIEWLRELAEILGKEAYTYAADRIEQLVIERDAIREAALREAYEVVHKWWFEAESLWPLPQDLILALIGEKK